MPVYKKNQSLSRGLAILAAISESVTGTATITDISRATGIHRTTVKRLLQTLIDDGFVISILADKSYSLSFKIRQLSEGFTDDEWISQVAAPTIGLLLQDTLWPSDLCTIDGSAVVIRETTHRFSTLSFHRSMIRKRLPLLTTAAGRAYFCFCSDIERQQLLEIIKKEDSPQTKLANNPKFIKNLVKSTVARGYAVNEGDWEKESNITAIALPIFSDVKLMATINIVFLKKIVDPFKAAEKYLPKLQNAVHVIEQKLSTMKNIDNSAKS